MAKQTGLRNRYRRGHGLSTYAKVGKRKLADSYGSWQAGKRVSSEIVAGRAMTYKFNSTIITPQGEDA